MGDGHGRRARATGHGHQVWLPEARAARRAPSSPRAPQASLTLHLTTFHLCVTSCNVTTNSIKNGGADMTGVKRATRPNGSVLLMALIAFGAIGGPIRPGYRGLTSGIRPSGKEPARDAKAPGTLVDLGGYKLHTNCEGKSTDGKPPVILIHGGGDFSF